MCEPYCVSRKKTVSNLETRKGRVKRVLKHWRRSKHQKTEDKWILKQFQRRYHPSYHALGYHALSYHARSNHDLSYRAHRYHSLNNQRLVTAPVDAMPCNMCLHKAEKPLPPSVTMPVVTVPLVAMPLVTIPLVAMPCGMCLHKAEEPLRVEVRRDDGYRVTVPVTGKRNQHRHAQGIGQHTSICTRQEATIKRLQGKRLQSKKPRMKRLQIKNPQIKTLQAQEAPNQETSSRNEDVRPYGHCYIARQGAHQIVCAPH